MQQILKNHRNVKRIHVSVCTSMLSILYILPSFSATNPQITKLIKEKQQKIAQLEQCGKKVTGFKIAGISTLGLTAVGIGGNIALASKNKSLNREIDATQSSIEKEQNKLDKINADIAAEKLKQAKAECDTKGSNWEWQNGKCEQKTPNGTASTASPESKQGDTNTTPQNSPASMPGSPDCEPLNWEWGKDLCPVCIAKITENDRKTACGYEFTGFDSGGKEYKNETVFHFSDDTKGEFHIHVSGCECPREELYFEPGSSKKDTTSKRSDNTIEKPEARTITSIPTTDTLPETIPSRTPVMVNHDLYNQNAENQTINEVNQKINDKVNMTLGNEGRNITVLPLLNTEPVYADPEKPSRREQRQQKREEKRIEKEQAAKAEQERKEKEAKDMADTLKFMEESNVDKFL